MKNILNISFHLGSINTQLVLYAQLTDNQGKDMGKPITSGFIDTGEGAYIWHYEDLPKGFQGYVKFYEKNFPNKILSLGKINIENVSTIDDTFAENQPNSINSLKQKILG